jgi:antitoxin FitA
MSRGSGRSPKASLRRHAQRQESSPQEAPEIIGHDQNEARSALGSRIRARFAEIGLDDDVPELWGEPARPATIEK